MGGRGSGSKMGGGGGGKLNVTRNMTVQEVNSMTTAIAETARRLKTDRDNSLRDLSNRIGNGSVPTDEFTNRYNKIIDAYDKGMELVREANRKLSDLYGVFVTGL